MKTTKSEKISNFIKNNLAFILAFIIPVIVLTGIFIGREIFPFGEQMYLRSDCYHQYAPFYKELYRKLTSGGSLTYSWDIGMGVNFTSLYAYYLASPTNLLLGLFPEEHIIEAMLIFYIIKISLSCTTSAYYLSKHFHTKSLTVAAFGLFYGFSSYFAAFSWNIMWLDCLILLPLILLGLEKLVKENRCLLYCITLALAVFSNYYIAIMICIFMVIYFAYLMFVDPRKKTSLFILRRFLSFSISSLVAGCFGFVLILPELYTLGLSSSGKFDFPDTLSNYFSILEMLSRNVMNMYASIFDAHSPNIYFSVCSYLFIPLYFFCSKVPKRERFGKAAILIMFLFSFNLNVPNYIWHGLHFPNSLPCRESFIFIFIMITMCFESFRNIKSFTDKQIFGSFVGSIALLIIIEKLYVGTQVFNEKDNPYLFNFIYLSMAFILFYLIIVLLARRPKVRKNFVIYLLFVASIAEVAINTDETGYGVAGRTYYLADNESISSLVDKVADAEDSLFYRTEKIDRKTKNDAAWNGYYGVSTFSSTANNSITELLGRLGFEKSANAYSSLGITPVTSGLLSTKYFIANSVIPDTKDLSLYMSDYENSRFIYKNNYWLPLGFMVDKDFISNFNQLSTNNPFAVQNNYLSAAVNNESYKDVFTFLSAVDNGTSATVTVPNASHVYIYITNYIESVNTVAVSSDNSDFRATNSFTGLKHRHIIDIGQVPSNSTITVSTNETTSSLQLYAFAYNDDEYMKYFNELKDEPYTITDFKDTHITGTVNAKTDGLLLTTINYDKGWTAYVDGKKANTVSVKGAFTGVYLSKGEHKIEFKYRPVGLIPGAIISFIALLLIIAIGIYEHKLDKRKKAKELPQEDTEVCESPEVDEDFPEIDSAPIEEDYDDKTLLMTPEEEQEEVFEDNDLFN